MGVVRMAIQNGVSVVACFVVLKLREIAFGQGFENEMIFAQGAGSALLPVFFVAQIALLDAEQLFFELNRPAQAGQSPASGQKRFGRGAVVSTARLAGRGETAASCNIEKRGS